MVLFSKAMRWWEIFFFFKKGRQKERTKKHGYLIFKKVTALFGLVTMLD